MIIDGKQKKHYRIFELFFTLGGWAYLLVSAVQILLTVLLWAFNLNNLMARMILVPIDLDGTVDIVLRTLVFAAIGYVVLFTWSNYNFRRFGSLDRRKHPENTSVDDIAQYFSIHTDTVQRLQNERYVELKETIV